MTDMNTTMTAIANPIFEAMPNDALDSAAQQIVAGLRQQGYSDLAIRNLFLSSLTQLGCVVTIHEPEE
jgi:hypothetical protein